MKIYNDLQNLIIKDFSDNNTKRVRAAFKLLGVKTQIPRCIYKNAIICSKLYAIDFLQHIKEFLNDKVKKISNTSKLPEYTYEERIIISGIVHLGLPSLFMKLDYCLNDFVIENRPEYVKTKTKKTKKYLSPYLEPLNLFEFLKYKNEKNNLHNLNVKVQRKNGEIREDIIKERKKIQANIIRNEELQMKNSSLTMHPLEALFCKIPLNNMFQNKYREEGIKKENKVNKESELKNDNIAKIQSIVVDEHVFNKKLAQTNNNVIITKNVVINENNTNLIKTDITNFHKPKVERSYFDDLSSIFQSAISYSTNFSDYNSYDWPYSNITQHDCLKKSFSFEYEYEEVEEESESDDIFKDEDMHYLIDDQYENINSENDLTIKDSFGSTSKFVKNMHTIKPNEQLSQNLEQSPMEIQSEIQSEIEEIMIKMFNFQIDAFPDFRLHSLDTKITTKTYINQMANSLKNINENELKINKIQSINNILEISNKNDLKETSNVMLLQDETMNETKKDVHIFDEILTEIRELSKTKQLNAVLEFLAILGDPIANLPNITELEIIRQWYETRLNNNKFHTQERNAKLINESLKLWGMPRPKITDIHIPHNPFIQKDNNIRWTWDEKDIVVKQINEVKSNYIKKIKAMMLNNTRDIFTTFKTVYYKNKLNRDFKKTYHCYFPAREADILYY